MSENTKDSNNVVEEVQDLNEILRVRRGKLAELQENDKTLLK